MQSAPGQRPDAVEPDDSAGKASLGFGCASLFGLPSKRDRRAVLEAAYDLGIRHFDVAPIYGLGLAEAELADFVAHRTDIEVATKFGLRLTTIGRWAGSAQAPMRQMLRSSPALKSTVRNAGTRLSGPFAERILYTDREYSVRSARDTLTKSLRALRVDHIEYFFLHEPSGAKVGVPRDLIEHLEHERSAGRIGRWGVAGDLSRMDAPLASLCAHATALQFPYDLIDGHRGPRPRPGRRTITFGIISGALPRIENMLASAPTVRRECSHLLGVDLGKRTAVMALLVRDALRHNPSGTVLVSSTRIGNLRMVCEAVETPLRNEEQVCCLIRQRYHAASAP